MGKWKSKNFFESFKNALDGIKKAVKEETNLKIQLVFAILAIILSIVLKISKIEFMIIIITIFLVIFGELVNTAIEQTVDLVTEDYNEKVKKIKDISAGASLIFAINSIIVGIIIFGEKIINLIK